MVTRWLRGMLGVLVGGAGAEGAVGCSSPPAFAPLPAVAGWNARKPPTSGEVGGFVLCGRRSGGGALRGVGAELVLDAGDHLRVRVEGGHLLGRDEDVGR